MRARRQQYYEELNAVRAGGDYERWIDFFAEAIRHSAEVAIETGRARDRVYVYRRYLEALAAEEEARVGI